MQIDYPEFLIPDNIEELITRLDDRDNRAVAKKAKAEIERGEFSEGLIMAVKKAIQDRNKQDCIQPRPAAEVRLDRILTITNSDGRKQARKS